ncbi:hypothetical protein D4764_07G0005080 [Takifugu flavidus]|uniref:Uncharacterized protein n=1 Tax=Takifugu flavidus TaxID=433684 RepID=A0A5C6MSS2_9TELE|nr:hypothetical protein D4764_07G0005080 [Takifugu flavidus]
MYAKGKGAVVPSDSQAREKGGESNFVKVVGFGRSAAGGESAPPAAAEARLRKFGFLNPPPHVRLSSPRSLFAEQQFHLEQLCAAEPEPGRCNVRHVSVRQGHRHRPQPTLVQPDRAAQLQRFTFPQD